MSTRNRDRALLIGGWVQEKLEGLTVAKNGRAYAVTDNDGLDDASGETVFLRLGRLR